ncbi:MAG: YdcF family protein [Acetobacteraceae bacterium]|nr:YdcF family protein [Acetobacteraceae bacterium]
MPLDASADGIVALTGGASRIRYAVELLASGRGQRLLITGVSPTTGVAEIARLLPERQHWLLCCVDLGYSAVNTIGNAVETRRWALDRGFRSLVVVTASYHMPRALLEIGHRLPGVTLMPFPVVTGQGRAAPWWSDAAGAKFLASEYVKYLVALARVRFDPPESPTATASRSRAKF